MNQNHLYGIELSIEIPDSKSSGNTNDSPTNTDTQRAVGLHENHRKAVAEVKQAPKFPGNVGNTPESLDKYTKRRISKVKPRAQSFFNEFAKYAKDKAGIDVHIPNQGGLRTTADQQALYAQGRTTPGNTVTKADGVNNKSYHQSGMAIDVIDNNDGKRYGSGNQDRQVAQLMRDFSAEHPEHGAHFITGVDGWDPNHVEFHGTEQALGHTSIIDTPAATVESPDNHTTIPSNNTNIQTGGSEEIFGDDFYTRVEGITTNRNPTHVTSKQYGRESFETVYGGLALNNDANRSIDRRITAGEITPIQGYREVVEREMSTFDTKTNGEFRNAKPITKGMSRALAANTGGTGASKFAPTLRELERAETPADIDRVKERINNTALTGNHKREINRELDKYKKDMDGYKPSEYDNKPIYGNNKGSNHSGKRTGTSNSHGSRSGHAGNGGGGSKKSSQFYIIPSASVGFFRILKNTEDYHYNIYELTLTNIRDNIRSALEDSNTIIHLRLFKYSDDYKEKYLIGYNHLSKISFAYLHKDTTGGHSINLAMVGKVVKEMLDSSFFPYISSGSETTAQALMKQIKKFNKRYYKSKPVLSAFTNGGDLDKQSNFEGNYGSLKNKTTYNYEQILLPSVSFMTQMKSLVNSYRFFYVPSTTWIFDDFNFSKKNYESKSLDTKMIPKLNLVILDDSDNKSMNHDYSIYSTDKKENGASGYAIGLFHITNSRPRFYKAEITDFLSGNFVFVTPQGNVIKSVMNKNKKAPAYREKSDNYMVLDEYQGLANNTNTIVIIDNVKEHNKRIKAMSKYTLSDEIIPQLTTIINSDTNVLYTNYTNALDYIKKDQYTFIQQNAMFEFRRVNIQAENADTFVDKEVLVTFSCQSEIQYIHNMNKVEADYLKRAEEQVKTPTERGDFK